MAEVDKVLKRGKDDGKGRKAKNHEDVATVKCL